MGDNVPVNADPIVETRRFRADRGDDGRRLDHVLVRRLADLDELSRTEIQGWIREGRVTVDGTPSSRPARRLALGAEIAVEVAAAWGERPPIEAEDLGLNVLAADQDLVAVDKPSGMVVHPTWGHRTGTLLNGLVHWARERGDARMPAPVHRLDRQTSGVVLAARTREAASALGRAFERREVRKTYLAWVRGVPDRDRLLLTAELRPDSERPGRMRVVEGAEDGLPSRTLAVVTAVGVGWSRLEVVPTTGRMHQIRVHLSAAGHPILGDPLYGGASSAGPGDPGRLALHAARLELAHPRTGTPSVFEAPVPEDLAGL